MGPPHWGGSDGPGGDPGLSRVQEGAALGELGAPFKGLISYRAVFNTWLACPKGTLLELYWSPKGAPKDEFLDFMLFSFSSVLAPKTFQNGLKSGPRGAPGCPGGGPGGPGGGSDVQMSISEAPECRAAV